MRQEASAETRGGSAPQVACTVAAIGAARKEAQAHMKAGAYEAAIAH